MSSSTTTQRVGKGMDRGYALSAMAQLRLAVKHTLEAADVIDRGILLRGNQPRFVLNDDFLQSLEVGIPTMQDFLKKAAELCENRKSYFKIDPNDVAIKILCGSADLAMLQAAWIGLRRRLELSLSNFEKYNEELKKVKLHCLQLRRPPNYTKG
ncbi:hypothetical protein Hypma_006950 [Hypsizygus marmoreus]|uniref:Uncharacterized protein n=1 Tax=Hypsizygus marmoreus TaxID=39966 RepID=A0A369JWJ4_HYPMA|nr:hypothetical protein Hypma_006950 [Hypsizygus marmoreus]